MIGIFQGVVLLIVCIGGSSLLTFNRGKFYQRHETTWSCGDSDRGMKSQHQTCTECQEILPAMKLCGHADCELTTTTEVKLLEGKGQAWCFPCPWRNLAGGFSGMELKSQSKCEVQYMVASQKASQSEELPVRTSNDGASMSQTDHLLTENTQNCQNWSRNCFIFYLLSSSWVCLRGRVGKEHPLKHPENTWFHQRSNQDGLLFPPKYLF